MTKKRNPNKQNTFQKLDLQKYENFFPHARKLQRHFTLILGPTNSGKTYHALNLLKLAKNGCYLAPLRLLALEKFIELNSQGFPCNLVTGEEKQNTENAKLSSQTIETFNTEKPYDTIVVDEVQMLADNGRGWAWSRAIFGANCSNIVLVGSFEAEPLIRKIIAITGDTIEVIKKERMVPLVAKTLKIDMENVPSGTAFICFSRKKVLELKQDLESNNHKVSVVYGSLSPEARRHQAEMFASGKNTILIATDAIGMGLNLPIKTMVFTTLEKFDGKEMRKLGHQEVKQIAGRAGRFGLYDEGVVTSLYYGDVKRIQESIDAEIEGLENAYVFPTFEQLELLRDNKDLGFYKVISTFFQNMKVGYGFFKTEFFNTEKEKLCKYIEKYDFTFKERYVLLSLPFNEGQEQLLDDILVSISFGKKALMGSLRNTLIECSMVKPTTSKDSDLFLLENTLKSVTLYRAAVRLFDGCETEQAQVNGDVIEINAKIEMILNGKQVLKKTCSQCGCALSRAYKHKTCQECYMGQDGDIYEIKY